jgi:hypothetical protein
MTLGPGPQPPTGTKRHYARFDPDMSEDELHAWAGRFVDAVLGDVIGEDTGAATAQHSLPAEVDEHPPEIV